MQVVQCGKICEMVDSYFITRKEQLLNHMHNSVGKKRLFQYWILCIKVDKTFISRGAELGESYLQSVVIFMYKKLLRFNPN